MASDFTTICFGVSMIISSYALVVLARRYRR